MKDNKKSKSKSEKELAKLEQGVTEDTPYKDIAEYKMVTYLVDDTINSQGS